MHIRSASSALATLVLALAAGACSKGSPFSGCPTGTKEVSGQCVITCTSDNDCLLNEVCSADKVCVAGSGVRDTGVRDTGTPVPDAGDAGLPPPDVGPDTGLPPPDTGVDGGVSPDVVVADVEIPDVFRQDAPGDAGFPDIGPDTGFPAATLERTTIDFGRLAIRGEATIDLVIRNTNMGPVVVQPGAITGAGASFYSRSGNNDPIAIPANDMRTLTFRFNPTAARTATASFAIDLCDGNCPASVLLRGEGILDPINCTPPIVDFGQLNPMSCDTLPITCRNDSSWPSTIMSWGLTAGTSMDFALTSAQNPPINLNPGNAHMVNIRYCPQQLGADTGTAQFMIAHPDPTRTLRTVMLTGVGGGPNIECDPTPIDLGLIGVGQTARRVWSCRNSGDAPLQITSINFTVGGNAELTITTRVAGMNVTLPRTIAAGGAIDVEVTYAPTTAGNRAATLTVMSGDRDTPAINAPIVARSINSTGCVIAIAPTTLEFGAVTPTERAEAVAVISNTGTGPCAVTLVGPTAGTNAAFTIVSPTTYAQVDPGVSIALRAAFQPTAAGMVAGGIQLQTSDPNRLAPVITLSGTGLASTVAVPRQLLFGEIPIGCSDAAVRQLAITNNGTSRIMVTNVAIEPGSSTTFQVLTANVSFAVEPGATEEVPIAYRPTMAVQSEGRVRVSISGLPPHFVSLGGTGTTQTRSSVVVAAEAAKVVDLLIVVDNSPGMEDEQAVLALAIPALVAAADASGADYQIGVTTTDPTPAVAGALRGMPAFVTRSTANRVQALENAVTTGVGGAENEQGLWAAAQAVTNATLLATRNMGFSRANAELGVLIVSDEDDQNSNGVAALLAQMSMRPMGQNVVRVGTITGGAAGCNGMNGMATAAPRYLMAANMTNGGNFSICADSFIPAVQSLATRFFGGARNALHLPAPIYAGDISVTVNTTNVPARNGLDFNWFTAADQGLVQFAPGKEPGRNSRIEVQYRFLCVSATCGDGTVTPPLEMCEDGNRNDEDACPGTCYPAVCGDGFLNRAMGSTETCDDGNTFPGDGCNPICGPEVCGNGIPEPPEECDLGMMANSDTMPDTCRTSCRLPYCHDGVRDTGERCDDGNTRNNDGCVDECAPAICGDGYLNIGNEQCDDGNNINNDACSNTCTWNVPGFRVNSAGPFPLPTPGAAAAPVIFPPGGLNDNTQTIPIGFGFTYLGTVYTNVTVSTNGYIAFDPNGTTSARNAAFPAPGAPTTMVAFWWDDLDPGRMLNPMPLITTELRNPAMMGNRVRVIEFQNLPPANGTMTADSRVSAEIRLRESNNSIEIHYGTMTRTGTENAAWSASAGFENQSGLGGQNILGCFDSCSAEDWPENTIFTLTPVP